MDTNLENTWVLQKFKTAPKTVEGLRQLLGFIDIIAHILIFSQIMKPLYDILLENK